MARMVCSEDTRIILVRTERPYVQSVVARVTGTVCSRGYIWAREGADPRSLVHMGERGSGSQVSGGRIEKC